MADHYVTLSAWARLVSHQLVTGRTACNGLQPQAGLLPALHELEAQKKLGRVG